MGMLHRGNKPEKQNVHKEHQDVEGVQTPPAGIRERGDTPSMEQGQGYGGSREITQGNEEGKVQVGRLHVDTYLHPGDIIQQDTRLRYRFIHNTGYWRRVG